MKQVAPGQALTTEPKTAEEHWELVGSEPFWMQDIRMAQRAIDAQRGRSGHSIPEAEKGGEIGSDESRSQ